MKTYDTLTEALNDLKIRGFTLDFNLRPDCIECEKTGKLSPVEFEITEVHRFEGMTNPDDSTVLYAIESRGGDKGVLLDAYGVYANPLATSMVEKLKILR